MTTPTPQDSQYRLLIMGDGSVRTVPLTGKRWTIGRSLDCSITLRDPTVSRRHLLLERSGDDFHFRDLGGANPAQIDGKSARQGNMRAGQQLRIGLTRLVIEVRRQPAPVSTSKVSTIVISRQVIDDELPDEIDDQSFPATAARVLQSIEWTFADLDDLAHAAEPLLELALNLTNREAGWLVRFPSQGKIETLAATTQSGTDFTPQLPESALADARRIHQPHLLATEEGGHNRERLLIPLGEEVEGLLVLEDPSPNAPGGQELLRLAQSLGKVVWHRLQETLERARLRDELERLRFHGTDAHNALLTSTRLQATRELVRASAGRSGAVLLAGEPGTEREDLARYLHAESARRAAPFVAWVASHSPAETQSREVFGNGERLGLLQRAVGGTLFIDQPTAMPIEVQQQLAAAVAKLRGESVTRLVMATDPATDNQDAWATELHQLIEGPPISIPPLRDDARDVLALAELFLSGLGTCPDGSPRLMTERCKRLLTTHPWPGNVRELRLTLESAAAKAGNQPITPRHLPAELTSSTSRETPDLATLEDVERAHIEEVMVRTGGVRARAAQVLGIASSTLYEKLKKYSINS